jgi:phenylacetate-CoA ligase
MTADRPFWDPERETMPREGLEKLQGELLRGLVERAYRESPFYRDLYDRAGVKPGDIRTVHDARLLPFTGKRLVMDTYPFGLLIGRQADVRELHAGTSPRRHIMPVFATEKDLDDWGERCARQLWMTGLRPGDSIQNAFRFGLSTGGFGFHYGALKMGMLSLPVSTGGTDRQIDFLVDLGVDAITMMPSSAMFLGMRAAERGIDLALEGKLRVGLFGAEPYSAQMKARLEELLGLEAYNEYGMNEFLGPGMACECSLHDGLHAWADHFLLECVHPATG